MVGPVDPLEGGELERCGAPPRTAVADDLGVVCTSLVFVRQESLVAWNRPKKAVVKLREGPSG